MKALPTSEQETVSIETVQLPHFLKTLGKGFTPEDVSKIEMIEGGHLKISLKESKDIQGEIFENLIVKGSKIIIPVDQIQFALEGNREFENIQRHSETYNELFHSQYMKTSVVGVPRELIEQPKIPVDSLKFPGDYFFSKLDFFNSEIYYLDDFEEIQTFQVKNLGADQKKEFLPEFEKLKRPVGPDLDPLRSSKMHIDMIRYKNLTIQRQLESPPISSEGQNLKGSNFNVFNDFIHWKSLHPPENQNSTYNPMYFLKMFGLQFGLKGDMVLTLPNEANTFDKTYEERFEGASTETAAAEITRQGIKFLPQADIPEENKVKIKKTLKFLEKAPQNMSFDTFSDFVDKARTKHFPLSFPTGWQGHATNLTISDNYLCFTNKGERKNAIPGRTFYKITKPEMKDLFFEKLKLHSFRGGCQTREEAEFFFLEEMQTLLGLEKIGEIEGKDQKVGNCTFASNKSSLAITNVLLELEKEKTFDTLKANFKPLHKSFTQFQRIEYLSDLKNIIKAHKWPREAKQEFLLILSFGLAKEGLKQEKNNIEFSKLLNEVGDMLAKLPNKNDQAYILLEKIKNTLSTSEDQNVKLDKINNFLMEPMEHFDSLKKELEQYLINEKDEKKRESLKKEIKNYESKILMTAEFYNQLFSKRMGM